MSLFRFITYRLTGPARVYTMRGKYRQFFLRVHDDGIDEVQPTNISVSAERTLEVVVETVRRHLSLIRCQY